MGKWAVLAMVLVGCAADRSQTARQYFERSVYPVLSQSCGSEAGCHGTSPTDPLARGVEPVFVGVSADGAYDVLVQEGYAGAFTDEAPLVTLKVHAGGPMAETTRAVIEQWFAIERSDRGW
jgi:hypothetical protein